MQAATASPPGATVTAQPAAASAELSALAQAQETGQPVEVVSETTPTERLLALPDGNMQYEVSSVPVRVADAAGAWVDINTDLVRNGDWWEPAASATPVRFTAGGSDLLDEVRTPGGDWITERWPHGKLPTPRIDGPTATYPNVFPGVDLKLTATDVGMASVYVVKTAEAAANHLLDDLHVEIEGADITTDGDGAYTAETESGDSVSTSTPLWWDSSDGGTYREPGDGEAAKPVEHRHTASRISLDVAATIDGEPLTYPIYIDPDWSAGPNAAWYTDVAYPNASYLNVSTLRVGRYAQYNSRMFFEFGIGALAGKQIIQARLNTTQIQLAAVPNSPLQVRLFGYQAPGFTWNQQNNGLWGAVLDTQNPGSGTVPVGWNVTAGVQATVGGSVVQFGFDPQDPNAASRRHFSNSATLIVTYNTAPNTPTSPKIDNPDRACGTASSPAHVSGTSVVVSVDQRDTDGGNVDTNFHLATVPAMSVFQSRAPGLLAQGRRSVTFTGLSDGTYAWYARGSDWMLDSPGTTAWCYFTVDNQAPAAPSVTTSATTFTVGQPVNVSLSSAADAAGYQYWLAYSGATTPAQPAPVSVSRTAPLPDCQRRDGGTRFACATGTTPVAITVAPVDALSVLWVAAYDKAGNVSTAKPLPLFTSQGTPAARDPRVDTGHAWLTTSMIDPLPTVIEDSNWTLGSSALSLNIPDDGSSWQKVTELRPGYTVPVLYAHEPADPSITMSTPGPAVDTTDSFTISLWVQANYYVYQPTAVIAAHWAPGSSFELKLLNGKFTFCRVGTAGPGDTASLVSSCVAAPTQAAQGEWVLVTGVWDKVNQQLRLDLGASASPIAATPNIRGASESSSTSGEFLIGPPPTSWRYTGLIANPVVVPGVMDSRQLGALASFGSPFTH